MLGCFKFANASYPVTNSYNILNKIKINIIDNIPKLKISAFGEIKDRF